MRPADLHCALFDTSLGRCGVTWSPRGLVRVQLPGADAAATRRLVHESGAVEAKPPAWVAQAIQQMVEHLSGQAQDFSGLPLDLNGISSFAQRVYAAARRTKAGQTITYGELATLAGAPGGGRAVGRALGTNPLALVVPCHRVIATSRRIGGFSAHGGAATKLKLLALEGVHLDEANLRSEAQERRNAS